MISRGRGTSKGAGAAKSTMTNNRLNYSFRGENTSTTKNNPRKTMRSSNIRSSRPQGPPLSSSCPTNRTINLNPKQKHTIYIQNSSTLAKREQELKKSALARATSQSGDTATTQSLTTATGSQNTLNSSLNTTFDLDHESSIECLVSPVSNTSLPEDYSMTNAFDTSDDDADDELYEEDLIVDQRKWGRDTVLMNILRESSEEEDGIYEDDNHSSSSSSGYVSDPFKSSDTSSDTIGDSNNDEDDNESLLDLSIGSLSSSAWRADAVSETEIDTQANTDIGAFNDFDAATAFFVDRTDADDEVIESLGGTEKTKRPPVAVVFEIDDYTDDSAAMGESTLLQFVKDFTHEMKDDSADDGESCNKLPARPSVKVYSTVGARRCDLKTMKQRVLSSETIVSTILDNRVKHYRQHMAGELSDRASSVISRRRLRCLDPLIEETKSSENQNDRSTLSLPSNSSHSDDDSRLYHRRRFSKDFSTEDIVSSLRGEDILLSEVRPESTSTSNLSRLQEKKRATEAVVSKTLTANAVSASSSSKSSTHRENCSEGAGSSGSSSHAVRSERELTNTLKEEAERRRQRLKDLRARRDVRADTAMERINKKPDLPSPLCQASIRPGPERIKQNVLPLRKNESISTGMLTAPTSNLSNAKPVSSVAGRRLSVEHSVVKPRSQSVPQKKKVSGISRFLAKFSGNKDSKADRAPSSSRKGTAREGYRAAVASRRQAATQNYSTPSRRACQGLHSRPMSPPPLEVRGRRAVSNNPHPFSSHSNASCFSSAAASIEPRRLFDDDSISQTSALTTTTCSSIYGRTRDDLAASTAKASASWV